MRGAAAEQPQRADQRLRVPSELSAGAQKKFFIDNSFKCRRSPGWELLTHQTALTPRLQGISVVAAINVMVSNTTLSSTGVPWGTPPMSGADLEPDVFYQGMTNVSFEGCRFLDNRGSGVNMYLRQSTSKSPPVSATFRDCTIDGTGRGGFELGAMLPNVSGPGVWIENCHVRNTTGFGLSIFDKSASAAPIHVADSSFAGTSDPFV